MADADELNRGINQTLLALEISSAVDVDKAALTLEEFIGNLQLQGMPDEQIESLLLSDLENNGRIFAEYRRSVKSTVTKAYNRSVSIGAAAQFAEDFDSPNYIWIAALVNTCDDCLPRHGQVRTLDQWQQHGLPNTGWSVCDGNCQCQYIPTEAARKGGQTRTELLKPIKVERDRARKEGREAKPGRANAPT